MENRRSKKHKLSYILKTDSQDSDDSCHRCNGHSATWEETDEVNTYISHQLSALSIPHSAISHMEHSGFEHPPRKKLRRRKSRKVRRTRMKSAIMVVDNTPPSPASSVMRSNTSDETAVEAMSVDGNSTDSSISITKLSDPEGADADDELSCWEGYYTPTLRSRSPEETDSSDDITTRDSSHDEGTIVVIRGGAGGGVGVGLPSIDNGGIATSMAINLNQQRPAIKREKLKTRHKTTKVEHHKNGGSSTSSPSMTMERAVTRKYTRTQYPRP